MNRELDGLPGSDELNPTLNLLGGEDVRDQGGQSISRAPERWTAPANGLVPARLPTIASALLVRSNRRITDSAVRSMPEHEHLPAHPDCPLGHVELRAERGNDEIGAEADDAR
jgi:hypothetical protein